jgi:hypothetical protein
VPKTGTSDGSGKFTYQVMHVNAEFANQVSDHDPQVVDIKPSRRHQARHGVKGPSPHPAASARGVKGPSPPSRTRPFLT